jgi:orotate phosphoribosyltransferase-like protein
MTERITTPRDRDALIEDYLELTTYGVATEDAARRLGVSTEQIVTWVQSRHTEARRRANRVVEGAL